MVVFFVFVFLFFCCRQERLQLDSRWVVCTLYIQTLKYALQFILYGEIGKVYVLFVAEGLMFLVFRIKSHVHAFFIRKFILQIFSKDISCRVILDYFVDAVLFNWSGFVSIPSGKI